MLRPSEAIIIALLDGQRTLGDVGRLWGELTERDEDIGHSEVEALVTKLTTNSFKEANLLVSVSESNRGKVVQYDPNTFVISKEKLNFSDRRLRVPYKVTYLPTMFCPQKCVYCYAKTYPTREQNLLGIDRLREIIAELAALGVDRIQMSGGDAMAHPQIFDILEMIVGFGMGVDLPTKLGVSYAQAKRLYDLGIDTIQVSLDSSDPETLDFMVGVKNYNKRVLQCLDELRMANIRVRINCVATPHNLSTLGPLIDFIGKYENIFRLTFSPYARSIWHHQEGLFLSDDDIKTIKEQVERRAGLYPHLLIAVGGNGAVAPMDPHQRVEEWKNRGQCTGNRDGFVILPDGKVTVCEELYDHPEFIIGDLTRQSVMEMWDSAEAWNLIRPDQTSVPSGPCRTCSTFEECHSGQGICWRDTLKGYGWDKHYYPDLRCPKAPEGARRI